MREGGGGREGGNPHRGDFVTKTERYTPKAVEEPIGTGLRRKTYRASYISQWAWNFKAQVTSNLSSLLQTLRK